MDNANYRYQQQAAGHINKTDHRDWLAGLPPNLRRVVEQEGFEQSKSKQRGVAAARVGAARQRYFTFMQTILSPENWACQQRTTTV